MAEQRFRILWLDNDGAFLDQYRKFLANNGFEVRSLSTAIEAEQAIRDAQQRYDLMILDVMVPTWSDEEEQLYSPDETDLGLETGLVFWKRNKEVLAARGTQVLVFTVRLDESIREEFQKGGLQEANFARKDQLTTPASFLNKVRALLRPESPDAGETHA